MGFWIFMFIMSLILPVLMIGFGLWFCKHAPGKINSVYGYRTKMSMKNMETWNYAHHYFGKLWARIGWGLLPVSILAMVFLVGKETDLIGWGGCIVMSCQCIALLLPVRWTERELRKKFDEDGNRI